MITSKRLGPRSTNGSRPSDLTSRAVRSRFTIRRITDACRNREAIGSVGHQRTDLLGRDRLFERQVPLLASARRAPRWRSRAGAPRPPSLFGRHAPPCSSTNRRAALQTAGKRGVVLDGGVVLRGQPEGALPGSSDVVEVFFHRLQKRQGDHRPIEHERIKRLHSGLFLWRTAGWRHAVASPRQRAVVRTDRPRPAWPWSAPFLSITITAARDWGPRGWTRAPRCRMRVP